MDFPIHIPLVEDLGFELLHFDGGEAAIALDLQERHTNSFKVAHGGISMTLLDVAMAHAARSVNAEQPNHGPGVVTIEMKTSFMRPGEGRIVASGKLLHRTATMAFCEGRVDERTRRADRACHRHLQVPARRARHRPSRARTPDPDPQPAFRAGLD